jgi:hypothetical protein
VNSVYARILELDRKHPPILMTQPLIPGALGRLHYGDPPLLERLRWMPYSHVGGLIALIGLACGG